MVKVTRTNILISVLSLEILMWNIKALALTVQKLFARLSKNGSKKSKVKVRVKNNGTHGKVLSQGILMWNIKVLALAIQKYLARYKFQRGRQNYRMTDRTKTICPQIFDLGGKKIRNSFKKQQLRVVFPFFRIFS